MQSGSGQGLGRVSSVTAQTELGPSTPKYLTFIYLFCFLVVVMILCVFYVYVAVPSGHSDGLPTQSSSTGGLLGNAKHQGEARKNITPMRCAAISDKSLCGTRA